MKDHKQTPEQMRERIRQQELKRNPSGGLNDSFNRAESGALSDLAGSLSWKGAIVLIVIVIIGFTVLSLFFK